MLKSVKFLFVILATGVTIYNSLAQTEIDFNNSTNQLDTLPKEKFLDIEGSVSFTLDDALNVALSDNPLIKVADKEVIKSEYAKKGTYASLFPQIEGTGSYQRTVKKQTMYMELGDVSQEISVGTSNTFSGGFSASMPIVSPMLWQSLKISALDVEMAIEQARASQIDMVEQVSKAFYSVLLAIDTYNVYVEAYNNSLENYLDVKHKFDVGSTSEYEMIRSRVQVQNTIPALYSSLHSIALAKWQLKALLGMDLDVDIACSGSLLDYTSDMSLRRAEMKLENNSDLQQLDIQSEQLNYALKMSKAENYPTLSLGFSYDWLSLNDTYKFSTYRWNPYSILGFSLSIPIFDGGKRRYNIRQAQINVAQLSLQRENAVRNLEVAWLQYSNAVDVSIRQYDVARSTVEQAQKGYDIASERYRVGKGTQLEVKDSQLQLLEAELSRNSAIYDFVIAKVSIDALNGKSNSNN